jgi:hypothetical protein
VAKYAALAALAAMSPGEDRASAIRSVARRWPGALREAELVGPMSCAARGEVAGRFALLPAQPRRVWAEADEATSVCLWITMHELLADIASSRSSGAARDPATFVDSLPPTARGRWPEGSRLAALVGPKLRSRSAYLWLAALCGASLPALGWSLFARAGHWDRRPGDPAWAHAGPDRVAPPPLGPAFGAGDPA